MSVTPQMPWEEPRSTSSHCGSENADDQRVPVLPSVAALAGAPAFSVLEAAVVLFTAALVVPPEPPPLELMVQVNVAEPDAPVPSVAVTVTVEVPAAVGVPEISPVEELADRPAGRPEAL